MRIGIDATVVAQPHIVGISRFIVQLVGALLEVDSTNEYYLCYRGRALKRPRLIWRPRHPRAHLRFFQDPFGRRLFRTLDVFHATYQRLPTQEGVVPYIGTLHDVFFLSRPDMVSPQAHQRWSERYRDVARRSQLIMTVSEFSKHEIVSLLGVEPERVRVVHNGASVAYVPQQPGTVERVRACYQLSDRYLLFGGGSDPRKNVLGALHAFAAAVPRLPVDLCLAISGSTGSLEVAARGFAQQAGLGARVRFLGFVPDADYPALMSGSLLYFFPSLFEGFGLPALEAMACGTPVVTSSTTALPEVCGDAAVLVDPVDVSAMAAALIEVVEDARLREQLRERGLRRAQQFTWRHAAEQTRALYQEAARR